MNLPIIFVALAVVAQWFCARLLRPSAPVLRRLLALAGVLSCGACAVQMGGAGYAGAVPTPAEVEGMRFVLRLREDRAEAIRVSPMWPPKFAEVARRAQIAVAEASGCVPVWAVGDPSVIELGLSCGGRSPPKKPKGRHTACDFLGAWGRACE